MVMAVYWKQNCVIRLLQFHNATSHSMFCKFVHHQIFLLEVCLIT